MLFGEVKCDAESIEEPSRDLERGTESIEALRLEAVDDILQHIVDPQAPPVWSRRSRSSLAPAAALVELPGLAVDIGRRARRGAP